MWGGVSGKSQGGCDVIQVITFFVFSYSKYLQRIDGHRKERHELLIYFMIILNHECNISIMDL